MKSRIPVLAVVGRPNVGKSTFFNRVVGIQQAIVEDIPGVTRDRNYALVEHFSIPFYLVDTGGFEKDPDNEISKRVVEQSLLAAEEADLIIAVFDGQSGVQPGDEDVVELLRSYNKHVCYAVNKCDGENYASLTADFYSLGIDNLEHFSALHGKGVREFIEDALMKIESYQEILNEITFEKEREEEIAIEAQLEAKNVGLDVDEDDLLENQEELEIVNEREPIFAPVYSPEFADDTYADYIKTHRRVSIDNGEYFDDEEIDEEDYEIKEVSDETKVQDIKVAIIGRPNVGKSTLFNAITGSERSITSDIAGTTRDVVNFQFNHNQLNFHFMDTAGLRRKSRVADSIEKYSVLRALRAVNECDVAVLVIDAVEGPTEQDAKIAGLAHEQGRGIVIVVNKWDLVEKHHRTVREYTERLNDSFKFCTYAPIVFVSAKTGRRCIRVVEEIERIAKARAKKVSTGQLNSTLRRMCEGVPAPTYRGVPIKFYYGAQVGYAPPKFVLFFNYPRKIHFSYLRFFKNTIRDKFGFEGSDIKIIPRKRG